MFKYNRDKLEIGFLHFGLGGFHRAHQAVFIDDAISKGNLGLGIASISQRDPSLADEMNLADSIYEVEESDGHASEIKTIGSIDRKSTRLNSSHIPLSRMPSSA